MTTVRLAEPPKMIHGDHVLKWRVVPHTGGEKHRLVVFNPTNSHHPFIAATWYPWNGAAEWASGSYFATLDEALEAFTANGG